MYILVEGFVFFFINFLGNFELLFQFPYFFLKQVLELLLFFAAKNTSTNNKYQYHQDLIRNIVFNSFSLIYLKTCSRE